MEENSPTPPINNMQIPQVIPNSVAVLVLGILSIVSCFCYGFVGLILGIIAIVLANKGKKIYLENPKNYTAGSFNNLKAGRICAIIGTVLSAIYFVFLIIYVVILGATMATESLPWEYF